MSLSRAFTTRLRGGSDQADAAKMPQRSNTTKVAYNIRDKISAPVQLLHTTNMLSYNAPDIPRSSRSSSTASKSSSDVELQSNADSTPPTSPDVSSPEPNHLSCYFKAASSASTTVPVEGKPPAIPKRSPSHTKKNSYEALARQRSVSRMSRDSDHSFSTKAGQPFSRSHSTSTRASSVSHASLPLVQKQATPALRPAPTTTVVTQVQTKESHPFGQELAQVNELAEEYSVSSHLESIDEEQQYLHHRGLQKLSPDEYLSAVQGLSAMFFPPEGNHTKSVAPLWI
ncbi:uncharacterized protein MAM_02008 [Metarhizium album ARSEF 1941]|uniref:Uncharacterized protein n=1 Tax=Metarhizium album (strain ARSEF 1941) TaxID=1081103 RepID=A0A0B2X3T0_METAS|nr:uncharacterized protein MAM_02008 [Metarhizium album ARSEF 1941]KHO00085.1 hypothetical protein MAM_02008 [Metarhizium album ARSEF 1941]